MRDGSGLQAGPEFRAYVVSDVENIPWADYLVPRYPLRCDIAETLSTIPIPKTMSLCEHCGDHISSWAPRYNIAGVAICKTCFSTPEVIGKLQPDGPTSASKPGIRERVVASGISGLTAAGNASGLTLGAWALYGVAAILAVIAFVIAYQDSSGSNKIVGGDAFNFIIYAGRATVWMGAAITAALIGTGLHIAEGFARLRSELASQR